MILEFEVKYNTETECFEVNPKSENVRVVHSGSSYLRIISRDQYGTIDCMDKTRILSGSDREPTNHRFLNFNIVKKDEYENLCPKCEIYAIDDDDNYDHTCNEGAL